MNVLQSLSLRFFISVVLVIYLVLASGMKAQDIAKTTVIKNGRLFDGERMIPKATVIIENGKIAAVGRKVTIPEGAEVLDGEGQLCPVLLTPMFTYGISRI
jgi:adenine deaminase